MLFSVCITILGNASAGGSPISQPKFNLSLFISLFFYGGTNLSCLTFL